MNDSPSPISLSAGLLEFVGVYMPSRDLASKTREEYERDVQGLVDYLEGLGLQYWDEVGLKHLQGYLAELDKRKLTASTRNRKTYSIKTFYNSLVGRGHLITNPAERLVPPSIPKREPRFLSIEEYNALLAQISNPRDKAIVTLFLQVGLRLSELSGLKMTDVQLPGRVTKDPENVGMIRIKRKGSKKEHQPLNWKACEAVKNWLKARDAILRRQQTDSDALFLNKYGEGLSNRSIQRMLEKYLDQAGIEYASVHTLRHTAATHYAAKGGDIKSIQDMLGHSSLETTQLYVSLAQKVQQQMVQKLAL